MMVVEGGWLSECPKCKKNIHNFPICGNCGTNYEVYKDNEDGDKVYIKIDSSVYRLVKVYYQGERVIIMVPETAEVSMPQTITYQNGKHSENLIIVK
jgi:hypothetical protein